jgi:hypothetical protein
VRVMSRCMSATKRTSRVVAHAKIVTTGKLDANLQYKLLILTQPGSL